MGDESEPAFDPIDFHERAVRTPSHHEEGVDEMRELLCDTLRDEGVEPTVDELGNVLATRGSRASGPENRASGEGPHLVLNTHVDTVPPHLPYERDGDVVRGRGACDAKGPLAALLAAFLRTDPERGRLTLAITSDEETLQTGAAHLRDTLSADGYVVGEPTGLDVCIAARGQCEGTVTVRGESGHAASVPGRKNPVFAVARVLDALDSYDEDVGPDEDPVLGRPKLTATILEGGEAPNRVPDTCRLTFDRRSVPPETSDSFRASLEQYVRTRLANADREVEIEIEVDLVRPDTPFPDAFVTDEDEPLVRTLAAASGGRVRPFGAATEASYFAADAPTVVFGPGDLADDEGAVAHSEREYVRLEELERAASAVTETVRTLLE